MQLLQKVLWLARHTMIATRCYAAAYHVPCSGARITYGIHPFPILFLHARFPPCLEAILTILGCRIVNTPHLMFALRNCFSPVLGFSQGTLALEPWARLIGLLWCMHVILYSRSNQKESYGEFHVGYLFAGDYLSFDL